MDRDVAAFVAARSTIPEPLDSVEEYALALYRNPHTSEKIRRDCHREIESWGRDFSTRMAQRIYDELTQRPASDLLKLEQALERGHIVDDMEYREILEIVDRLVQSRTDVANVLKRANLLLASYQGKRPKFV